MAQSTCLALEGLTVMELNRLCPSLGLRRLEIKWSPTGDDDRSPWFGQVWHIGAGMTINARGPTPEDVARALLAWGGVG